MARRTTINDQLYYPEGTPDDFQADIEYEDSLYWTEDEIEGRMDEDDDE